MIHTTKIQYQKLTSIALVLCLFLSGLVVPARVRAVADTGGYPWADAELIRASTYDWGYTSCQPAMVLAKTCSAHMATKFGRKYYQSDPWRYDVRNCTSYVAWRINQIFGVSIPAWGNANNWDSAARKARYQVTKVPFVGSIAAWEGYYGHVAYVTSVNPDGSVNVEQYNKAGTGEFSRQSRVRADNYIHIGTLPTPALQPQLTEVTPIPQAEPVKSEPQVVTQEPVAPLASLSIGEKGGLPVNPGVQYLPALDPRTDQVNVYAVEWHRTNSGKLEISKSNGADGNTSWEKHWVTNLPTAEQTSNYLVADANADGHLDLYVVDQQKITILDGAADFATASGEWTPGSSPTKESASYSVADYDGNGSLDLYTIWRSAETVDIQILDGTEHFAKPLAQWQTHARTDTENTYVVGDHDRDGRADVYELGPEVIVYAATTNYQQTLKTWKPEDITS